MLHPDDRAKRVCMVRSKAENPYTPATTAVYLATTATKVRTIYHFHKKLRVEV